MSQALSAGPIRSPSARSPVPKTQVFYAVVLHDFVAERADELDAKAGDPISVVAQSNREWFVAKPIGRLGKPGLIPVSFVQIRDPVSNQPISDLTPLMDSGSLPRVEDWKKQMLNYKANSIALGILDDSSNRGPVANSPYMPSPLPTTPEQSTVVQESYPPASDRPQTPSILPEGLLLSADVVSFHKEMDEYWFRVHAQYQPFNPSGSSTLPPARELVLFRAYNDFFDYQTALLDTFPREAGRERPHPRILPYMPGPANDVNDQLSAARREELNEYLHSLSRLNRTTARYIVEHHLTRGFFALKPGDVEKEADPQYDRMAELNWYDPTDEPEIVSPADVPVLPASMEEMTKGMKLAKINPNGGPNSDSEGSDYGDEPDHPSAFGQKTSSHTINGNGDTTRLPLTSKKIPPYEASPYRDSAYSRSSTSSSSRWPDHSRSSHNTQATSPISQSRSSAAGSSSRSHSLASPNTPSISANNPQTAFVKIKVFDRVQDDLIAIRVHPRVTHEELMDKIQQRLGGKVSQLSYRESSEGSDDFVPLEQDEDLSSWIESTDKLVLYAD